MLLKFKTKRKNCHFSTSIAPLGSRWVSKERCQRKQKTSENSNFWVLAAVFWPKLNKLRKTAQKLRFSYVFWSIFNVFADFSILTEKQRLKPRNSSFLKISASFDTHLDPRGAILVEEWQFFLFVLNFGNTGTPYNFLSSFKIKSEASLIGFKLKNRHYYSLS